MRVDEMILKANKDGKTYINHKDGIMYSGDVGFLNRNRESLKETLFSTGWEEKHKFHLTIAEAEKELDCVIDVPGIMKLFRPMSEIPDSGRYVFFISNITRNLDKLCGYYDKDKGWRRYDGENDPVMTDFADDLYWIDRADLIKLLPKQE